MSIFSVPFSDIRARSDSLPYLDKVSHQEIIDGLRWSSHVDFADTLFEIGLFALRKADKGDTQVVTTRR